MSKYTKGKAEIIKIAGDRPKDVPIWYINIGGHCMFSVFNVKSKYKANAAELVRRWNAFEEGGCIKTAILDMCEASVKFEHCHKMKGQEWLTKAIRGLESALAQDAQEEVGKC